MNKLPPLFTEPTTSESLFEAARQGDMAAVRQHIEQKKAPINQKDEEEGTPFHWAASKGRLEVVDYLLENDANPNTVDEDRESFSEASTSLSDNGNRMDPTS